MFRFSYVVLASTFAMSSLCHAQSYPAQPVRAVVPWPPGGSNDTSARIVMQEVSKTIGQQVIIDNRPGAGSVIGTGYVAKAPADGYTLLVNSTTHVANPHLYKSIPYDTLKDFLGVSLLVSQPQVLVVHPSVPAKTVSEFIALAKKNPGKILYASSANGSQAHLSMALFAAMSGTRLTHVPYKGGAPQVTGLVSGEVHCSIATVATVINFIQAGKLRPLGVNSPKRISMLANVPTISEAGVPGYELNAWIGVLAPAAMPKPIVNKLNAEIIRALREPAVVKSLTALVLDPWIATPEEFNSRINADYKKYAELVRITGATID